MIDGKYYFTPLGYEKMQGLTFTVYYADGSTAFVAAEDLSWGEFDSIGLTECLWDGCPVEFCLLLDSIVPGDTLVLTAPETVQARLQYMGISADFSLTVNPGHNHEILFTDKVEPTPEKDGMEAHYLEITWRLLW